VYLVLAWPYSLPDERRRIYSAEPLSVDLADLRQGPQPSLLRPVEVTAEMVRIPDGIAEKRYTLRAPGGSQVRGLRLEELVVLLKGLA
jgi:hypothetical protein